MNTTIRVEILTTPAFEQPVIGKDEFGMPYVEPVEGLRAELPPHFDASHFTEAEWFSLILSTAVSIPTGLLTSYLYDLLTSKRAEKIVVNGVTLEGDKKAIEEILKDVIGPPQS
jgi:hypothetical protein